MSDNITKRVGLGTAYGFAKAGGYEGTVAEFTELLGNIAIDLARIENLSVTVTTLPAGSQATASLNGSVLSLGIPKGDKGDKGNTGNTGAPAGFGTVSATVDANIGTPSVEVTASGSDTAKNFAFAFHNLKGQKGDKGDTGEVSEAELAEALEDFSENGTVANAEQLTTKIRANDQTPYLFRTSGGSVDIGDREYINGIVGGTVAWNQLANPTYSVTKNFTESDNYWGNLGNSGKVMTIQKDHIYLVGANANRSIATNDAIAIPFVNANYGINVIYSNGDPNGWKYNACKAVDSGSGQAILWNNNVGKRGFVTGDTITISNLMLTDLTQMFGSTIADYIYSLEQATAGAGVAFFKSLFPKPYYAYNSGELKSVSGLVSHNMVGFNAFDLTSGKAKVVGGHQYEIVGTYTSLSLDGETITPSSGKFTPSKDGELTVVGGNSTTCVHLVWDGSEDGNYEPYQKWSYPLDTDLELRGKFKLDANNNLYASGDIYPPNGQVQRKWVRVDLGSIAWNITNAGRFYSDAVANIKAGSAGDYDHIVTAKYVAENVGSLSGLSDKSVSIDTARHIQLHDSAYSDANTLRTALNGVYADIELATPTTESADPYTSPQIVNDFGTEEWVLDSDAFPMPVGHNTDYPIDLKAKVEMAPNSPDGDGDYIVRQTNGTNEYVAFANNATIQNILSRLEALEG